VLACRWSEETLASRSAGKMFVAGGRAETRRVEEEEDAHNCNQAPKQVCWGLIGWAPNVPNQNFGLFKF
jgi:hypothetical protein